MFKVIRSYALAAGVVFALVCGSASAQRPSDHLQPMDIFNLQSVTDPQISPDGKRIVYVRRFSDINTDKNYSNIWVIGFDGSDNHPLTTGNHNDTSPRWSPEGNRII